MLLSLTAIALALASGLTEASSPPVHRLRLFPEVATTGCGIQPPPKGDSVCSQLPKLGVYFDSEERRCVRRRVPNGCYVFPFRTVNECLNAVRLGKCDDPAGDGFRPKAGETACKSKDGKYEVRLLQEGDAVRSEVLVDGEKPTAGEMGCQPVFGQPGEKQPSYACDPKLFQPSSGYRAEFFRDEALLFKEFSGGRRKLGKLTCRPALW